MTRAQFELAGLRDRAELAALVVTYARGMDDGDWTAVRRCFTEDAIVEGSIDTLPIDTVLARSRALAEGYAANMHLIGNQVVELSGDTAEIHSYVVAYHWKASPPGAADPDNLIAGGRYHDKARRTADGWRIAYRRVRRDWNSGRQPAAMLPAADTSEETV